jgi:hypothetical protein
MSAHQTSQLFLPLPAPTTAVQLPLPHLTGVEPNYR